MNYCKNLELQDIIYFCEFDLIWKTEEWRDIPDYENYYQVSDLGRIKSLSRVIFIKSNIVLNDKILCVRLDSNGYCQINLTKDKRQKTFRIHQLVAISFLGHIPCGFKLVVNHKNFIKSDNQKLNLEIITQRENTNRKHKKGTSKYVGVCWDKIANKWVAMIVIEAKQEFLGRFINELDASKAYENKLKEISK